MQHQAVLGIPSRHVPKSLLRRHQLAVSATSLRFLHKFHYVREKQLLVDVGVHLCTNSLHQILG